jgi:ComF family protein
MKTLSFLREIFLPQLCAVCGKPLVSAREAGCGLCAYCIKRFTLEEEGEFCSRCGKPLVSEQETCLACRRAVESSGGFSNACIVTAFPYQGDYQKLLRAYKFASKRMLGAFLADCFIRLAKRLPSQTPVWVPVPPRPGKIKKSGWDQMETVARRLEQKGKKVLRCLERLPSISQKALNREKRKENLKGKIILQKPFTDGRKTLPKTAFLFDDVYTTGATMEACAKTLKNGGAETVYGLCLFYD